MSEFPISEPESLETSDEVGGQIKIEVPIEPAAVDQVVAIRSERNEEPLIQKHFVAPAFIPIERITDDLSFCIRSQSMLGDDEVAPLAMDIARLGQLFPVDLRLVPASKSADGVSSFQIVSGFRRVAALRFLQREKVLARLHTDLSDHDAILMALASAVHSKSVSKGELEAHFEDKKADLPPAAIDMLDKALNDQLELSPESSEEEVDADELAADCTSRLGQINQDLSLLADVFSELNVAQRDELLNQLRYAAQLVTFLEEKR